MLFRSKSVTLASDNSEWRKTAYKHSHVLIAIFVDPSLDRILVHGHTVYMASKALQLLQIYAVFLHENIQVLLGRDILTLLEEFQERLGHRAISC